MRKRVYEINRCTNRIFEFYNGIIEEEGIDIESIS